MIDSKEIVPYEVIDRRILHLRGHKVLLDADLAELYGVPTKALNQAVKRNRERFPEDFVFQLAAAEKVQVVTLCDHLARLKYAKALPYAFTEHGALMAASVLNSPRAVEMSVFVVRAFVRLSQVLATHAVLARKLSALEKQYDEQFKVVFEAIRALMKEPAKKKKAIGFGVKEAKGKYGK